MTPVSALLLDVDGTLVDTWDLYVEAYARTLEPHLGRRPTLEELRELRPRAEIRFLERAVPGVDRGRVHGAFLDHYRALHDARFGGVYPGVREMLRGVRERGIPLGIVTGKSRGAWTVTRAAAGLGSFGVVVCDDDVVAAKPDPEGLGRALDTLGADPAAAVYVGDSVRDAVAARAAGVRFAGALWPKAPDEVAAFRRRVEEVGLWRWVEDPVSLSDEVAGPGTPP